MADENNAFGKVQIADEVIAIIAGAAALEIEGVDAAAGNVADTVVEFFGGKNQSKGVKVKIEDGEVSIDIDIAIAYGVKAHEVAAEAQNRIKTAIETMAGLKVIAVNVNITGITVKNATKANEQ